jgi:hypothetical protein
MPSISTQVSADGATVVVREVEANVVELQAPAQPAVVEVLTPGPAGPPGASGVSDLAALNDVNVASKTDKSVLYYDAAAGEWKGDDLQTIVTLTDGGNF